MSNCKHTNIIPTGLYNPPRDFVCLDCEEMVKCPHKQRREDDNGLIVCDMCMQEILTIEEKPEWKMYRNKSDASRCYINNTTRNGVEIEFSKRSLKYPKEIVKQVDTAYKEMVRNRTVRGDSRLSLICVCTFHILFEKGNICDIKDIYTKFGLTRKNINAAMTRWKDVFPHRILPRVKPSQLIPGYCAKLGLAHSVRSDRIHIDNAVSLAIQLEDKYPTEDLDSCSGRLVHSTPKSVAIGILAYYLCIQENFSASKGLTYKKCCKLLDRTSNTVDKILSEIYLCTNYKPRKI